ncbi:EXLDI family protein [Nocardia transvalensis]|uniref:EXLDI family protein n=1 Tax=Nocardia transvalensis TaxID=37333 RepID=A0A7W9PDL5_9NOCA|nr:EXLDI protein [Nocardia transvalensis]MBB5913990.1 EXLDI family protein [Nocardia transvalensis]
MPNKTVYVSDDDLPLFQRAQELVGGNLSGAIVTALRRFIELEEGRQEGFDEVLLRIGHNGGRQVRFSGALLGEMREINDTHQQHVRVYRSRKGKFVLHMQTSKWAEYPVDGGGANWIKDLTNWRKMLGVGDPEWGDFTMDIYDSVTDLKGRIPDKLYRRVNDIVEHPQIEDLDI